MPSAVLVSTAVPPRAYVPWNSTVPALLMFVKAWKPLKMPDVSTTGVTAPGRAEYTA